MNPLDEALRLVGSAPPPDGLEQRVNDRLSGRLVSRLDSHLDAPGNRFPVARFFSAMAIAAGIAVGAVTLVPGLKQLTLRDNGAHPSFPRTMTHPAGAFGGASAAHIPAAPVPVQPVPVNQGRGHSRSAQMALTSAERKPLPRGVALPRKPQTRIQTRIPAIPIPASSAAGAISAER